MLKNSMTVESNFIEEEIALNLMYMKSNEGFKIIVDSGTLLLVVSKK